MAIDIGPIGIFSGHLNLQPSAVAGSVVRELEELGYGAVWIPESAGKEVFTHCATLLAATSRIAVVPAIANVWARDPMAMANAARTLREAYGERFVLGVGIGHRPSVELRGHRYERPLASLRAYLAAMKDAPFRWPEPVPQVPILVGALGPRMLELSATAADGAIPYLVTVGHTRQARAIMGDDAFLAPEQAVVLTEDAETARRVAREHAATYLLLGNYRRSLRRQGWSSADLNAGGSDALIDALVAWGSPAAVAERVQAHREAGADHVAIQVLGPHHGFSAWSYASLERAELRRGELDLPLDAYRALAAVFD
ncbi:MAG: TIGR03620 family F420-dependent LLM class oxidoreductase [Acidimicrobiia bacterium]|nr:TIGR03620 family F420-dependent LLM class oxidoreductase [Acidimicrobiia bacterium]